MQPDMLPMAWHALMLLSEPRRLLVLLIGVLLFAVNLIVSIRRREPAGDNPWDASTLEWATSSPPPEHNFTWLPPIRSERPVFDWNHRNDPPEPQPLSASPEAGGP